MKERLPVPLTGPEIEDLGRELAEAAVHRSRVEADRKEIAAEFRDTLKIIDGDLTALALMVNKGTEDRLVECREEPCYDRDVVEIYRLDTGEIVRVRQMTAAERQLDAFEGPKLVSCGETVTLFSEQHHKKKIP
jgi:hypothetical protein